MNAPRIKVKETSDCFVYGRLNPSITNDICQEIADCKGGIKLKAAGLGNTAEGWLTNSIRSASVAWLKNASYTSQVLGALVIDANDYHFKFNDLVDTKPAIQYTVYNSYRDHYDWHQDYYDDDPVGDGLIRLISISVCLSHDDMYEGAEFCIKDGCDFNVRQFKMRYGDFIVFPSNTEHRVNALRSGERISLVNWYGKPITG